MGTNYDSINSVGEVMGLATSKYEAGRKTMYERLFEDKNYEVKE